MHVHCKEKHKLIIETSSVNKRNTPLGPAVQWFNERITIQQSGHTGSGSSQSPLPQVFGTGTQVFQSIRGLFQFCHGRFCFLQLGDTLLQQYRTLCHGEKTRSRIEPAWFFKRRPFVQPQLCELTTKEAVWAEPALRLSRLQSTKVALVAGQEEIAQFSAAMPTTPVVDRETFDARALRGNSSQVK